jgi:hypothetical protein
MDIEEIIIKMFAQFIKFLLGFLTVYFGLESFGIGFWIGVKWGVLLYNYKHLAINRVT